MRTPRAAPAAAVSSHEVLIASPRIGSLRSEPASRTSLQTELSARRSGHLRLEPASRTPLQKPRAMRPSPPPPARIALETVPNATAAGPDPEGSGADAAAR